MKDTFQWLDLVHLSVEKLQCIEDTLTAILTSTTAIDAFAQIIDGTPTKPSFNRNYGRPRDDGNVSESREPSEEAVHIYRDIRASFTAQDLEIPTPILQAYQNASLESLDHALRLLEIIASSIHTFAGNLYAHFHPRTNIKPPPPTLSQTAKWASSLHFFVDFYHFDYRYLYRNYPYGLLDVIGYWAETQILGGAVLFERDPSESYIKSGFVHAQKCPLAFQLTEDQIKHFAGQANRADAQSNSQPSPALPFLPSQNALLVNSSARRELRIYKQEHDLPPEFHGTNLNCVRTEVDEDLVRQVKEFLDRPADSTNIP